MKNVWTRREVILLPAIIVGLVVLAPFKQMLRLIDLSRRGAIYLPPEVRSRLKLDPKWIEVIKLKYYLGLTDKAIAKRMDVNARTVRHYWMRIQDAFLDWGISYYSYDPGKDPQSQIALMAWKLGLID